jgi:SAM-dependent methyltransferase
VFSRASATYNTIGPRHFDYFAGRLLDLVAINHGDFVLDAATGTGAALFAAAHNVGATGHVLGIDLSAAMLLRASRAVQRSSLSNVELKLGDAEHLELMTGTVDVVLCAFGISAFTNPEQALSEFRRVLRPGGRLGVVDTFGWYFQHDARWRRHAEVLKVFGANGPGGGDDASERRLQTMVAGAGFVEVVAVADSCPLVFEDEDQWWRWSWSHGTRGLLESVSPRRRPELKRQLCATLADCRDDGGRIQGQLVATIVLAVAPGP